MPNPTPIHWSDRVHARPTLRALREGLDPTEIETVRSAYRAAGEPFGDSEDGVWAWIFFLRRDHPA